MAHVSVQVSVPRFVVGIVIGRNGEMIKKIQNDAGVRIQFKPGWCRPRLGCVNHVCIFSFSLAISVCSPGHSVCNFAKISLQNTPFRLFFYQAIFYHKERQTSFMEGKDGCCFIGLELSVVLVSPRAGSSVHDSGWALS